MQYTEKNELYRLVGRFPNKGLMEDKHRSGRPKVVTKGMLAKHLTKNIVNSTKIREVFDTRNGKIL